MVKLRSKSVKSAPIAFSYVRFSSPKQAEGDSLRRQTEKAADWCERNGVRLDTSTTLHDLGKSAFTGSHRVNPDRHALAAFLKLVEQGRVPRGSVLICEALDRLSREHIQPALMLLLNLLQSGVRVVQLIPAEQVFDDKSESMALMMAIMELSRGNSESRVKSERCGDAWGEKKRKAREDGKAMSANCPRWIELRDGKLRLIPERAALVKRIFDLAANGYGLVSLAKKLTGEGIPSFGGRRATWTRSYLALILADRRALGEHQPKKNGKPDGEVIPNYYPAVVTEAEWLAVKGGRQQRAKRPGRVGKHVNPFAGLLKCATDGGPYYLDSWVSSGKRVRQLVNFRATEGLVPHRAFPYDTFEAAVLKELRELDPREVLGGRDDGPDRLKVLAGELAQVDAEIAPLEAELEAGGDVPSLARVLRKKEQRRAELRAELEAERQKAATPAAQTWGEMQSLTDALAAASDPTDIRLRLRSALRQLIAEAWMLVVPRGPVRLAAVQFWFVSGVRREYLIYHEAAAAPRGKLCRPARWSVRSFATLGKAGDLDLRDPKQAAKLAAELETVDLSGPTENTPKAARRRRAGH